MRLGFHDCIPHANATDGEIVGCDGCLNPDGMGIDMMEYYNTDKNKVEKISKGSLDSIPSPPPSVKIQMMRGKVCLRCKGKTLLGIVNKLLKTKTLSTWPNNVLPYYLK